MLSFPSFAIVTAVASLSIFVGCSWLNPEQSLRLADDVPGLPPNSDPGRLTVPAQELPPIAAGDDRIALSSGDFIPLRYSLGRPMLPVEALVSADGFDRLQANAAMLKMSAKEKHEELKQVLRGLVQKIDVHAPMHDVFYAPEIGYFSGWIAASDYAELKNVQGLPVGVTLAPATRGQARPHSVTSNHPTPPLAAAPFRELSGLERMGVSEFLALAQADLGTIPKGSRVRVGVTDTGITLAHPAFRNETDGGSRVEFMKDFTTEGAGYISPQAKIKVERSLTARGRRTSQLIPVTISAQLLTPDALDEMSTENNGQLPFRTITDEVFLLPKALVEKLEEPQTQVRLGVLQEASFANDSDQVDINGNGKTDDEFYFFHVPASGRRVENVWIDFSATGHFRGSRALRDFNETGDAQDVMSEKIGVSLEALELKSGGSDAQELNLTRVSLVGFDPGNHGSHVAGIIGAGSTFSNVDSSALARGVAPAARLMMNRVCSNNGGCSATRAIIDLAKNGAQVINMSLGGLRQENDGYSVQETVINRLTELYDVLFVISAGNSGPGRQTVGSPSTARHALSVAATATPAMILSQYNWLPQLPGAPIENQSDDDFVMYFSSRGPSAAGGFKPNISAPGTQLSSVQLNAAPGFRAGLDVYWGTSMAAPAAAGAATLLIDAALAYNEKNPAAPLPTDALTIRRVLLDSARAFRVTSLNTRTGEATQGIYTWIDQGYGMVSLPNAWRLLKAKGGTPMNTGVTLRVSEQDSRPARLDYKPIVLKTMPNGLTYKGQKTFQVTAEDGNTVAARQFGQGLWLSETETDTVFEVHFSRTLSLKDKGHPDVGRMLRELNTSAEQFELETVYYGSHVEWLKIGVPQTAQCADRSVPENKRLTLIGSGAIENSVEEGPTSPLTPLRASSLFVCLKKTEFAGLPPGDHGALIRAYRVSDGQRDVVSSFEIPVYVTVPHHSASRQAQFAQQGDVGSFMVDRHYVRVPEGVSVLRVSAEVPEKTAENNCSSVRLMVLAGLNTAEPDELGGMSGLAQNCTANGTATNKNLVARMSQLNPQAGVWDIHVFGRFQFPLSHYKLSFDYATFDDIAPINGTAATISAGNFGIRLRESTFDAVPDEAKSTIQLTSWLGRTHHTAEKDSKITAIPSALGETARRYGDNVRRVTISTTSVVPGLDIDLYVESCTDEQLTDCERVAQSGQANAEERVSFEPAHERYYVVKIDPYDVPVDTARYTVTELISTPDAETGRLGIVTTAEDTNAFQVNYRFDTTQSKLLAGELFRSGKYEISGECRIANASGVTLAQIPVHVLSE